MKSHLRAAIYLLINQFVFKHKMSKKIVSNTQDHFPKPKVIKYLKYFFLRKKKKPKDVQFTVI